MLQQLSALKYEKVFLNKLGVWYRRDALTDPSASSRH
jgi:hypothetical protein